MNKKVNVSQIVITAPSQRGRPNRILSAIAVPITSYSEQTVRLGHSQPIIFKNSEKYYREAYLNITANNCNFSHEP